jgi:hypothetical protein
MTHRPPALPRFPILPLIAVLTSLACLVALPGMAAAAKPARKTKATTFEACHRGCRYRTIQKAVDAAGSYAYKNPKAKVSVAIRPGRYVEGVVLDGLEQRRRFDGMTIEGTRAERTRTILEGRSAAGRPAAAQNGIEAIGVDGIVIRDIWARNFESAGFFVHADAGGPCVGYTMINLLASGNHASGLAAQGCLGGKMIDSAAYRQGAAGFAIGETPCDARSWSVLGGEPCQRAPQYTLLKNDESYENTLGFAGTNSKYVRILENAFFDNGTGVVASTLEGVAGAPNGWNVIERNDVFWNNLDPYLAGSGLGPGSGGLGEVDGQPLNYPTGVGIVLHGGDDDVVRGNHVFGNFKWGIASFSGPGETVVADPGNTAKNVDNEIVENVMGREGADPNGEFDIWNDDTGGGNCWGANSPNSTFAPGNGKVSLGQIYPTCPQGEVGYAAAKSFNPIPGLQVAGPSGLGGPATILGYAATDPPQNQQCSWVRRLAIHPPFQKFVAVEVTPRPGEVTC